MSTHKLRNSASTRRSITVDLGFRKAPHIPVFGGGGLIESSIVFDGSGAAMPIVAIRLHNQSRMLENKVGLPAAKHWFVHLECKSAFGEFVVERLLNGCHFDRELLLHAGCADFFSCLFRHWAAHLANTIKVLLTGIRGCSRCRFNTSNYPTTCIWVIPRERCTTCSAAKNMSFDMAGCFTDFFSALLTRQCFSHASKAVFRSARQRTIQGWLRRLLICELLLALDACSRSACFTVGRICGAGFWCERRLALLAAMHRHRRISSLQSRMMSILYHIIELKRSYYLQSVRFLQQVELEQTQTSLFDALDEEVAA